MQARGLGGFPWQSGYGGFSVSPGEVGSVAQYIERQEAHHQATSFEHEYRQFLKSYGVEYDERYVWDCVRFDRPFRARCLACHL